MEATQMEFGYDSGQDPQMPIAKSEPTTASEYPRPMVDETFRSIDEQFVKHFNSIEDLREFLRNGSHNFKILKVTCATVEASLHLMLAEWFNCSFKRATHCFFILMDIQGTYEDINTENLRSLQSALSSSKPLVIQWTFRNSNKHCVFYKPSNETELIPLNQVMGMELTEEELIEELTPEGSFSLTLLLKALSHGLGGFFAGDLSKIAFDVEREFDGWRLLDYATRDDDDLSLRFLKLVEWDLTAISGEQRVLEIAAKYSSPQSISALLDQPIIGTGVEPSLSISQKDLLKLVDVSNNTPLTIAIEEGRVDTMEYLILCGADINHRKKMRWNYLTPIQLAWNNKFYDKVLILLEADSPFPDEYHLDDLDDSDIIVKLKELTDIRRKFHENIIDKDEDKVNDFIRDYPRLRHAYNSDNQTALVTALKSKAYEMFALLESKKFLASKSEDLAALKERLSEQENNELKEAKHRHFGRVKDAHIINLLSKWRTHGVENEDRSVLVRDLFERLDQIPEVSTVLKVVEHAEALEIIFDFNNDSIVDLDPTQAESTSGSCDYKMGRLYVGAKQPLEALGTLAHELTHLAMQTVFDNDCNPYTTSDEDAKSSFGEIVEKYRNLEGLDPIIARVFTAYKKYPKQWPSELIVRVPHLLATHHKHKDDHQMLENLRKGAPELFSFYSKNVQRQLEKFIKNPGPPKAQIKLRRLNDLLGQLQAMEESKIRLQSPSLLEDHQIDFNTILILSSDLPQLTKSDLYQTLKRKEGNLQDKFIFTGIDQFRNDKQAGEIYHAFQSPIKPILIVDCSRDYDLHCSYLWETIHSFMEKRRIILMADLETTATIQTISSEFQMKVIEKQYNWMDLEVESQSILLEHSADFQGYPIALNKLAEHNSSFMKSIPFQDLLQGLQIKIGKSLPLSYGYDERFYIERTLQEWPNNIRKFRSTGPVIIHPEDLYRQKIVLIADAAGMGKSTLLTHFSRRIKERDPSCWVLKYDLNNHTDLLEEQEKKKLGPLQFLREKLLNFQTPFENTLFEESLAGNKVVLMLDAFDEISPRYKEVVLELVEGFHGSPIKQLWITTRPHLKIDLERKLGGISYVLKPFSFENQVEFLIRFWTSVILRYSQVLNRDRIRKYAFGIVEKLSNSIRDKEKQLTGVPLQTRMLGEAFAEEFEEFYHSEHAVPNLPKQLDILVVYEKFLDRKYLVYVSEKNKAEKVNVATKDLIGFLKGGINLRKIHQQLALESLFPKQKQNLLISKKHHVLDQEKLSRIGLVEYIGNKPRFVHRTFSEYYVMDFLICQLGKPNQSYVREFLLKEILLAGKNKVMRAFLDSMLRKMVSIRSETYGWYGQGIDRLWKEGFLRNSEGTILHIAVAENNENIITFLLESLKGMERNTSTLREMFSAEDNQRDRFTVWHLSAYSGHSSLFTQVNKWAEEVGISRDELKSFILLRGEDMCTILHFALYRGYTQISIDILNMAKDMLTRPEFKNLLLSNDVMGLTPWGLAALSSRNGLFISVLKSADEILDSPEFENFLLAFDVQNETAWHKVAKAGDLKAFDWFFSWSKSKLTAEDIKKSLLKVNNSVWPQLAYRRSVEVLEKFRQWSEDMSLDFVHDVLFSRDPQLEQAWHRAAERGDVTVLQKLIQFCQELSLNLPDQVILSKNEYGRTIWQIAAMFGKVDILEYVLNISRDLQLDLKNDLLLAKDNNGKTSWHSVATTGNVQSMTFLWNLGRELSLNLKEELLLSQDGNRQTAWFLCCVQGRYECVEMLWNISKELLDSRELKALLQSKDENGEYLWHRIAENTHLLQKYWEYCLTTLDREESEKFLLSENLRGRNVWHQLASHGDAEGLKILWKMCGELKPKMSDRKTVLLHKDNGGATPLHLAAHKGQIKALEKLLDIAMTADFTSEELKALILDRDVKGNTSWHQLHPECLQMLWDFAIEIRLDPKRELLICKGIRNQTLWHMAASYDASYVLEKLYELCESISLKTEEYRMMFLDKAWKGRTVWHITTRANSIGVLETLRKICKEQGVKVKEDILSAKDNKGKTIWHSMVEKMSTKLKEQSHLLFTTVEVIIPDGLRNVFSTKCNTTDNRVPHVKAGMMQKFHEFISEEDLTSAEFKNVLLSENKSGNTLWHLMANRYPEYIKVTWSLAKASKLSPEDFKELLHHQDKFGDTVWHKMLKSKKAAELKDLFVWGVEILDSQGLYRLLTLTNADAKTVWHVSAEFGAVETMKVILDNSKAKLDQQSLCETMEVVAHGETALSLAMTGRHVKTVKFLLEIGSDSFARKWYDEILKQAVLIGDHDVMSAISGEISRRSLD